MEIDKVIIPEHLIQVGRPKWLRMNLYKSAEICSLDVMIADIEKQGEGYKAKSISSIPLTKKEILELAETIRQIAEEVK